MRSVLALTLALGSACAPPSASPDTVVLVVLDTARADRVPGTGGAPDRMPNLAELAEQSLVFDHAYAAAPWTLPSHASLFTGLEPHEHGCHHGTLHFDGRAPVLAEDLRDAGFATGGFTNNPWITDSTGLARGFRVFVEVFRRSMAAGRGINRFVDVEATGLADAGAARTVASVDQWLDGLDGEPAFVFVNFIEAHLPYDPPAPWRGRLHDRPVEPAEVRRLHDTWLAAAHRGTASPALRDEVLALYDEELAYLDHQIGQLVEVLRSHDRLDRALLVVTSDHGEAFGQARLDGIQLVDHQLSVRDELLRVPLLIRWPAGLPAGRSDSPVSLTDVRPLIRWAVGLDSGALPTLVAPGDPDRVHRASYGPPTAHEAFLRRFVADPDLASALAHRSLRTVRRGRYKLVASSDGPVWLYDLIDDPDEATDIAALHPDVTRQLQTLLPPPPQRGQAVPPPDAVEALEALGYTEGG